VLWKPFSPEGTNFRTVLDKAVQADGQVKERYQSHRDTIALLCKPEPELNAAIPSANPAKTMQGSEVREWECDMGGHLRMKTVFEACVQ
jgi:programmed cell death 6-interacting protein